MNPNKIKELLLQGSNIFKQTIVDVENLCDHYDYKIINVKDVNALIRLDTTDEFIMKEVIHNNTYRKLNIVDSDIVMDFGANIGAFTIYALKRGAFVHSYEPDRENFLLANINIKMNNFFSGFELFNTAAIGNDDKTRPLSINVKRNKGAHSLVTKRYRDTSIVECENINNIINKIKPTVIKMDIEGGEYECLKAIKDFKSVRELIVEFHHAHLNDIKTKEKYREIINILKKHFSNVEYRKETKKAWVSLIYCN